MVHTPAPFDKFRGCLQLGRVLCLIYKFNISVFIHHLAETGEWVTFLFV